VRKQEKASRQNHAHKNQKTNGKKQQKNTNELVLETNENTTEKHK
jgi:hypothetical protein